jgi:hypothetical protein
MAWTITSPASEVAVQPASGTGDSQVTVTFPANETTSKKEYTVTVTAGDKTASFKISQKGKESLTEASVAQILTAAESDTDSYQLTGTSSNLTNTTYGNFDLTDDIQREGAKLVKDIEECGHLKTGFVGTPYLLHALTKIGRSDVAYKLLLKETFPSWLFPVTKGATTMWERWDGMKVDGTFATPEMNSFNHYAYGSVGDWLYTTVAGIDSDVNEPGYKHIIFRPLPIKELGYAKARIITENGDITTDIITNNVISNNIISEKPQLLFDEDGNLIVTINGISKKFIPVME